MSTWIVLASMFVCHPAEIVTIEHVLDTNTVIVRKDGDRDALTVDLAGVGTPETVDPKKPMYLLGARDPGWTRLHLLAGSRVLMERVGESSTGRPLVVLYRLADRFCWNAWLVEVGGAFFTTTELVDYSNLEEKAQAKRAGLWALAPKPVADSESLATIDPTRGRSRSQPRQSASRPVTLQSFNLKNYPRSRPVRRYPSQTGAWDGWDEMMAGFLAQSTPMFASGGMGVNPNQHTVGGYWRGGTWVNSYRRTNPNGTTFDNFGSR